MGGICISQPEKTSGFAKTLSQRRRQGEISLSHTHTDMDFKVVGMIREAQG